MRWQAPPPVFPIRKKTWGPFDVAASLFVVAVATFAGLLLVRGAPEGYGRLAIVWLCLQVGALVLVVYFWTDRSASSRQALHAIAIVDLLALGIGLLVPGALPWLARLLDQNPMSWL